MAKKILIVEDEASLSGALVDKFTREGFMALSAKNGVEGLRLALNEAPDIILLDIIMPEMDGMTMLEKLRQDPRGQDVPIIILTNLSDADKVSQAIKNKVYDFLVKSTWSISDVVKAVKQKLK